MTTAEPHDAGTPAEPLRSLYERVATDPELRKRLADDPIGTLHAEGIEVNPELPVQVLQLPLKRSDESWLPITADGRQLLVLPVAGGDGELSTEQLADVSGGYQWGEFEFNVFSTLFPATAEDLANADRSYKDWENNPARLRRIGKLK
jgi:hypothetical protein